MKEITFLEKFRVGGAYIPDPDQVYDNFICSEMQEYAKKCLDLSRIFVKTCKTLLLILQNFNYQIFSSKTSISGHLRFKNKNNYTYFHFFSHVCKECHFLD